MVGGGRAPLSHHLPTDDAPRGAHKKRTLPAATAIIRTDGGGGRDSKSAPLLEHPIAAPFRSRVAIVNHLFERLTD